jgi:hypothetical protein
MPSRQLSSVTSTPRRAPSRAWWLLALVLIGGRIAVVPITLGQDAAKGNHKVLTGDIRRFFTIATHKGTPYRDFEVEYPPLMLGAIKVLDSSTIYGSTKATMWAQLALDLGIAGIIAWGWGRRASLAYLIIGAPFLFYPFLYLRLDLLSVALAVGGIALVRKHRPALGGVALALACFAKVWPVLIAPTLLVRRSWRAVAAFVAVGVAGLVAWVAWAGTDGPMQVVSMRGAVGWEIESTVGAVVRAVNDYKVHLNRGAWRVGVVPGWANVVLAGLCLVTVAAMWALAARRRPHGALVDATAAVGAIAAFLIFSPLLSPQFLVWMVPFAAIVAARGDRLIGGLVLAVVALSVLDLNLVWELVHTNLAFPQEIVILRNVVLVALVVLCARRLAVGLLRRPALRLTLARAEEAAA